MSVSKPAPTRSYREQFDRMKRYYERFAAIDQGRPHNTSSDNYKDDIYGFFLNCYHLKDWIKYDPAVLINVKKAVEDYIDANLPLQLCADICNSLKHLRLDRDPRSDENPAFGPTRFKLDLGPGVPSRISLKCEIDTDSGPVDAFELATKCVSAWDAFLGANGL